MNQIEKWPAVLFVVILLTTAFVINGQFNPWLRDEPGQLPAPKKDPDWTGEVPVRSNDKGSLEPTEPEPSQSTSSTQVADSQTSLSNPQNDIRDASDCVAVGWLGDNLPNQFWVVPETVIRGDTNLLLEPGKKLMIIAPANTSIFPEISVGNRFHIKYGDDCGPQVTRTNIFEPSKRLKKIHGFFRVLVQEKTEEECEKSGVPFEGSVGKFWFGWQPKNQ